MWQNVAICTGANGGNTYIGNFLSAAKHVEIGNSLYPNTDPNNIALDIFTAAGKGIKVSTPNSTLPVFSIANPNVLSGTSSPFTIFGEGNVEMASNNPNKKMLVIQDPTINKEKVTIYADGRAYFGVQRILSSHPHANAVFQVSGKMACKELVVVDPSKWADFVFSKTYPLKSLKEVESFYLKHKHLPEVPSEEDVYKNGINTAEMDAVLLQKIEELFLYVVSQNKRMDVLEKENAELKALLKSK